MAWPAYPCRLVLCLAVWLLLAAPGWAGEERALSELDITELLEVELVTASRRTEPLSQIAGAVTVLDEEDIFRSGATTIPDILKLVPGLHVARVDTDKWAVGLRGFSGLFDNKQLVMIDGRPITSPGVTGVFWNTSNIPVSLILRVEVVRGVWTSLWGADSFTGVINIITKPAARTQGWQSITQGGNTGVEQLVLGGGKLGDSGHFRAYASAASKSGNEFSGNSKFHASQNWNQGHFGFRADWMNAYTDDFSLQADFTGATIDEGASGDNFIFKPRTRNDLTGYAQLSWDRATGLDAGIRLRTSYTRANESMGDMESTFNTWDMEVQYAAEQAGAHLLTSGIGGRFYWDEFTNGAHVAITPNDFSSQDFNAFVQDKITLSADSLYLILGTKVDFFDSWTMEVQPTARLLHTRDKEEYWLAVSQATRASNRWSKDSSYRVKRDEKVYAVNAPDHLGAEKLTSFEGGYRRLVSDALRLDITLYLNEYDDLTTLEFDRDTNTASIGNTLEGTTYGVETLLDWNAAKWLTIQPSVSLLRQEARNLDAPPGVGSPPETGTVGEFKMSVLTIPAENVGFDLFALYMKNFSAQGDVEYFALDAHASWRAKKDLLLEIIARNLFVESGDYGFLEQTPSIEARLTWDF